MSKASIEPMKFIRFNVYTHTKLDASLRKRSSDSVFHRRLTDSQHAGKKPFDCRSKLSELLQRSTKGASSFHLLTTNLRLSHTCCPPAVHTSTRALGRSDKRCPHPFVTGEKPARERGRSRTEKRTATRDEQRTRRGATAERKRPQSRDEPQSRREP